MALTFGQILSGAGAIARSTREEQSKQLQLQEQQMRLAELRRLQYEQELERQNIRDTQGEYKTAPLFIADDPMQPSQFQTPQQQATQAQGAAQPQQQQAAAQETQTAETRTAGLVAPAITRQMERLQQGPAGITAAVLAQPFESTAAKLYYAQQLGEAVGRPILEFGSNVGRQIVSPGGQPAAAPTEKTTQQAALTLRPADQAINRLLVREGGLVNNPADRGGVTNFGISQRSYPNLDIANLTREDAARIYKRDYWDAIGADELPENIREIAFDAAVNQGPGFAKRALIQSEGNPERYLQLREQRYRDIVERDPSQEQFLAGWLNRLNEFRGGAEEAQVAATQAPANEQNPATAVAEQGPPQTGVTEQTQRILANTEFYQGNPNAITPEMQNVANQRQELVRMAEVYRRNGVVSKYQETLVRIKETDDSLIYLQGMAGINELRSYNNPLRLEKALSYISGQTIRLRPRTDGKYDYLVADPDGNFTVASAGVSKDELANHALFKIDQNAAAQANEANIKLDLLAREEAIRARYAMDIAGAEARAARPSVETIETSEGPVSVLVGGTGDDPTFRMFSPGTEEERGGLFGLGAIEQREIGPGFTTLPDFNADVSSEILANWNK